MPPCPATAHWWQTQVPGLLVCWQLWLGAYSVGFFFFSLPVMLPSEIPKLPTDPPVRGFPTSLTGEGDFSSLPTPSPRWLPVPKSFASVFVFYILSYLLLKRLIRVPFWVSGVLCQCSEVVLWKLLNIQMIFWRICEGESGLPVLFLHHLAFYDFQ